MAFFSVIIPLYNKENFVEKTIQSVLGQTFQDFEIIIVEDCSIDNSFELVSNITSSKIKIIRHIENKGLSASRNTGIQNSEGNYVAFLDADDLWKSNYLEKLYYLIQNFPEAKLFATNYEEIYSNKQAIQPATNLMNFKKDGIVSDFFESNLSQAIYCCSSVCVEKSVFDEIGGYNEKITFGEDIDFNIRANLKYKLA
jgi:glycosyltransferase involved in cell wall biosynthesis